MSSDKIHDKINAAGRDVLVEVVKLAQKRGMSGDKGSWKEFLAFYDRKLGASLSDPSKRSIDILVAFLKTFGQKDDLKIFDKVIQCRANKEALKRSCDGSPEQRLVCLTLQHPHHSIEYSFPSYEKGWLVTKSNKKSEAFKSTPLLAVDCEMALCNDGTDALVKICVVDQNFQVKLETLVIPDRAVVDYRTEITGVTAKDFDGVTCTLADVQKRMKKFLKRGTILVGHALNNDLQALKLDHARVIDTSYIFKYRDEPDRIRPSLNNLCKAVLNYELRKVGAPHNCHDDACAAMKLVLAKIELGVDDITTVVCDMVPKKGLEKLLLHRIPVHVPLQGLCEVVPGNFTLELKKGQGDKYSVYANFKTPFDADQAFGAVEAIEEKDSSGLPQKFVSFKLASGVTGTLCIRKMAPNGVAKRAALEAASKTTESRMNSELGEPDQAEDGPNTCNGHISKSKKLKRSYDIVNADHTEKMPATSSNGHVEEIERLKKELSQRDEEIASLNRIIANLVRKGHL